MSKKVIAKNNKQLKRDIKKYHRKGLTNQTGNIYLQRLTRKQWIDIGVRRITLWGIFCIAIGYFVFSFISNFVFNLTNLNQINPRWLLLPYNSIYGYVLVVLLSLISGFLPLFFNITFIKQARKKTNWVENEDSGTAHFLSDERNPQTIKPVMEAMYYPRTYFLAKGDWIIRLEATKDYDEFLNQASEIFIFNDSNGSDLKQALMMLKIPTGYYQEEVKYTCANDVITDLKNISNGKLNCSVLEFKTRLKEFLISKNLNCILIQTAGDSANAYVLGATGSGKTTKLNYPTIIANANAISQPSMFISDPKGELYNNLSGYLTARGYEPYSLDLFDLIRSMGWNPLQDIYSKFLAKGILKEYLKQYNIARIFFNSTISNRPDFDQEAYNKQKQKILSDVDDYKAKVIEEVSGCLGNKRKLNVLASEYGVEFNDDEKELVDEIALKYQQKALDEFEAKNNSYLITWKDQPIIDNKVNMPYDLLTINEYNYLKDYFNKRHINDVSEFYFDDSCIKNQYVKETPYLNIKYVEDKNILKNYVCSIHTGQKASEKCICDDADDKLSKYIIFDNYVFKTVNSLQVHYSSTLNTQCSEQIKTIQNAIFHCDKPDHWIESASKVFSGIIYHLGYMVEDDVNAINIDKFNIFSIVSITNDSKLFNDESFFKEKNLIDKNLLIYQKQKQTDTYEYNLLKYRFQELSSRQDVMNLSKIFISAEEEGKSIMSTFDTKMNPFLSDGVKLLTSFNDITFEKLISGDKPKAIFVGINVNDPTYHPFIVLFISTLHQKLSEKAKKSGGSLNRYFMFMLDEFGNIPAIPNYGKILSTCRSENIKFMSIVQSNAQIEKNYEKDKDNIITNKGLNIYIKSNDLATAEYYSKVLGSTMISTKRVQSAKQEGWVIDKKEYKQRSLMTPDEIFNLDCKYYNDTLFIANSKPLLVQVKPWYKIFNTKNFSSYRPIQYKLNEYSINKNLLNFADYINGNYKYIIDYYKIKQDADKVNNNKEVLNNQQIQELRQKIKVIEEQEDFLDKYGYYSFSDMLIYSYDLKFEVSNKTTLEEFHNTLFSMNNLVNKSLLLQNFSLFETFEFAFSKSEFVKEINDYLAGVNSSNIISSEDINNYNYMFNETNINASIILLAKQYLNDEIKLDNITNDSYLLEIINNTKMFIDDIIAYELTSYIKNTNNNYEMKLYSFMSRYKDFENDNLAVINAMFKALISLVDKTIYATITKTVNNFILNKEVNNVKFNLLNKFDNKYFEIFLKEAYNKESILFDNYWSNTLKTYLLENKEHIDLLIH